MARREATRLHRKIIPTIIGAGITEQWYFDHLRKLKGYRIKLRPRFFGSETADGLMKRIKEVLEEDGIAICVFDADVSTWNEAERKKLEGLRQRYKHNANVVLCDSMPAIEYWFLLHFKNTNRHFGTSKAVVEELKHYIPKYDKSAHFLSNEKWVAEMMSDGKDDAAKMRAKAMGTEGQSYSNVYKAFEKIETE